MISHSVVICRKYHSVCKHDDCGFILHTSLSLALNHSVAIVTYKFRGIWSQQGSSSGDHKASSSADAWPSDIHKLACLEIVKSLKNVWEWVVSLLSEVTHDVWWHRACLSASHWLEDVLRNNYRLPLTLAACTERLLATQSTPSHPFLRPWDQVHAQQQWAEVQAQQTRAEAEHGRHLLRHPALHHVSRRSSRSVMVMSRNQLRKDWFVINALTLGRKKEKRNKKKQKLTLATGPNTYQERREETEEGVVPKIASLPARQLLWLMPLSSHMQVTSCGCRRCPLCPLTWFPTATVSWTVPLCLASTCSSLWSSCCRWRTLAGNRLFFFYLLTSLLFLFSITCQTITASSFLLSVPSSLRSWFPSPSTCPSSWWRSVRSSSSRTTSTCTMRRQTAACSARPWTSLKTWDRSSTSSQTRPAPSQRTRWCFADAPSWARSTLTKRMVNHQTRQSEDEQSQKNLWMNFSPLWNT